MKMRLMMSVGILFLVLNTGVLAQDPIVTNDELISVVYGGEAMNSLVELTKQLDIDDKMIEKGVESTLDASGVQKAYLETSALLTIIKDGHKYVNGIAVYENLEMPTEFDVNMNYEIDVDVPLYDPNSPTFNIDSSTSIKDLLGNGDTTLLNLFELSELEGEEYDRAVMEWLQDFCGITFGNIGIDQTTGIDIPMFDSRNGVTCRWGESQEIGLRM